MHPTSFESFLKKINLNLSSKTSNLDQEKFLYLTTHGRKSKQPREIEIWFTHAEGKFYVIAEYTTSNWVLNLQANPTVRVRVADNTVAAQARVVTAKTDPELHKNIQALSIKKYGWGDGLVVELVPEKS